MRCQCLFGLLALAGVREGNAQHLLTDLVVTPCLNNTLVPAFSTDHYLYTAMEADPLTSFVAITATPVDPSSTISVLVDGKVVPASHVPLHNATDGPGPDAGTLIDVLVASKTVTESYKITLSRPLCPPKLWTLEATPGVLTPAFDPATLNYTLMLPNASVDFVTFTDTYPMPTGRVQWTADGVAVDGASDRTATIKLDADTVVLAVQTSYVWHPEVGYTTYTVTIKSPAAPDSLLSQLQVVPCLNNTLVPPFRPTIYNYQTSQADCMTDEVEVLTKQSADATVKVEVSGIPVDPMHVKLHNATDGPGADVGTTFEVLVTSPQGTEDYTVNVKRPLCPPKLWTLEATPGVLTPAFDPATLNYTLMLPNASVDFVTFTDTYPMPTGRITFTALRQGHPYDAGSGRATTILLGNDAVTVLIKASYVWHPEVGFKQYAVVIHKPLPGPGPPPPHKAVCCVSSSLPTLPTFDRALHSCNTSTLKAMTLVLTKRLWSQNPNSTPVQFCPDGSQCPALSSCPKDKAVCGALLCQCPNGTRASARASAI